VTAHRGGRLNQQPFRRNVISDSGVYLILFYLSVHDILTVVAWDFLFILVFNLILVLVLGLGLVFSFSSFEIVCFVYFLFLVFTARCNIVQSAVLLSHVVCLVCLSVCDIGGS